jgi:ribosomal RNA assembly protein
VHRVAGRVIGKNGRTRTEIEEATGVNVSIHGSTVAIIGNGRSIDAAVQAIEKLLSGASHASVYRFLQQEKRRMKLEEFGLR